MDPKDMKEEKYALNTRMFLLIAGAILIFNALTSNIPESTRWLTAAKLVSEYDGTAENATVNTESTAPDGTNSAESSGSVSSDEDTDSNAEETSDEIDIPALIKQLEALNITVADLRIVGYFGLVMALIRSVIGLLAVLFSNRVKKAKITFSAAIVLVICEVIYAVVLASRRALGLGALLYAVLVSGVFLWGALRMRKIAKNDPERVLIVNPGSRGRKGAAQNNAQKKSIREKAMLVKNEDDAAEEEE